MTTVINVRGRRIEDFNRDPLFLYVGRRSPRQGFSGSRWKNPWTVDAFASPEACVNHYRRMAARVLAGDAKYRPDCLTTSDNWKDFAEGIRSLHLIRGRVLGCWCTTYDGVNQPDRPCHAVELAKLADSVPV